MVFDSLSELRLLAQSSLALPAADMALKQFFTGATAPCCCWTIALPEGPDLQLQSITHGVMSLHHSAPTYGQRAAPAARW